MILNVFFCDYFDTFYACFNHLNFSPTIFDRFFNIFFQLLQKQLKEAEYGTDMQTVKLEYERHQKEHKVIDQFQGNVEKCREAEVLFNYTGLLFLMKPNLK